jgi:RNA polymerase sigma-70 factor, ECF subfamily
MSHELLPDAVPDEELIARLAAGDAGALTTLFRRRQADIYRVALLMTGSAAAAEDVTQDVFMVVIHDAARYEPGRATAVAWLCGIARNQARRRIVRDKRIVPLSEHPDENNIALMVHPDPAGEMEQAERIAALRAAVLSLPVRYREVVVLCDLQGLTYIDAAAALNCAVGTVRSRLHRARTLLSAKMRARFDILNPATKRIARCLA